ncbi:MAG TPA: ATP-binding protein, partial [Pyrinomonadaceae bacterium]
DDAELIDHLTQLQLIANRIDSEVDFLAWELRPSVLDDLGLVAALENFVKDWSRHFNIPAEFHQVGLDGRHLLPEIEINLYRIGQEALNNICKHAKKADNVSVLLERRDGTVSFIVEDNGDGFEPSEKAVFTGDDRGMGLLGMKERAELVGGAIEIESAIGKGTTIFVRVPAQFDETK